MNLLSLIQVIFNNRLKYPFPQTVTVVLVSTDTHHDSLKCLPGSCCSSLVFFKA